MAKGGSIVEGAGKQIERQLRKLKKHYRDKNRRPSWRAQQMVAVGGAAITVRTIFWMLFKCKVYSAFLYTTSLAFNCINKSIGLVQVNGMIQTPPVAATVVRTGRRQGKAALCLGINACFTWHLVPPPQNSMAYAQVAVDGYLSE